MYEKILGGCQGLIQKHLLFYSIHHGDIGQDISAYYQEASEVVTPAVEAEMVLLHPASLVEYTVMFQLSQLDHT
jgi:hypothetical protein